MCVWRGWIWRLGKGIFGARMSGRIYEETGMEEEDENWEYEMNNEMYIFIAFYWRSIVVGGKEKSVGSVELQ